MPKYRETPRTKQDSKAEVERSPERIRTGTSFNLFPFLIPPSLFQDVGIQVLHHAMPSDECISSPMLREADAELLISEHRRTLNYNLFNLGG